MPRNGWHGLVAANIALRLIAAKAANGLANKSKSDDLVGLRFDMFGSTLEQLGLGRAPIWL
jgi:hypothetical protein